MKKRELMYGILIGGAAGIALGMVLAPGRVEKRTRRVSSAARVAGERIGHLAEEFRERVYEATEAIKQSM